MTWDTVHGCLTVLEDSALKLSELAAPWATAAHDEQALAAEVEVEYRRALLDLEKREQSFRETRDRAPRKDECEALAWQIVEERNPATEDRAPLLDRLAFARANVESSKATFKVYDRIAGNAQSALAHHREEAERADFAARAAERQGAYAG